MRTARVLLEAETAPEHDRERETRGTGVDVHRRTTGEVLDAEVREPTGTGDGAVVGLVTEVEDPVGDREVDDRHPDGDEDDPGQELRAVSDGTADERGRDDREHELKTGEEQQRDAVHAAVVGHGVHRVAEAREAEGTVEAAARVTERQREAEDHPQNAHDADRRERHEHHVERALGLGHAAVEEREPGRHQQHKCGAGKYPGDVAGIHIHRHPPCHGTRQRRVGRETLHPTRRCVDWGDHIETVLPRTAYDVSAR